MQIEYEYFNYIIVAFDAKGVTKQANEKLDSLQ